MKRCVLAKSSLWKFPNQFWYIHSIFRIPFISWVSLNHKTSYFPESYFTFYVFILLILLFWSMNVRDLCYLKTKVTTVNYCINVFFMQRQCCWGSKRNYQPELSCLLLQETRSNGQVCHMCFFKSQNQVLTFDLLGWFSSQSLPLSFSTIWPALSPVASAEPLHIKLWSNHSTWLLNKTCALILKTVFVHVETFNCSLGKKKMHTEVL